MSIYPTVQVRRLVVEVFDHLIPTGCSLGDVDETVRLQKGRQVARVYRTHGVFAMWMMTVGLIQFYDDQGNMLQTVNLLDEPAGSLAADTARAWAA